MRVAGLLAFAFFGIAAQAAGNATVVDRVQAVIKARIGGGAVISSLACQGETVCGIRILPVAYRNRNHLPLWIDASLGLEKAEALAGIIGDAGKDGLAPQDYHWEVIGDLLAEVCEQASTKNPASVSPDLYADLDLMLTDAFLLLGSHLAAGRVNPETLHTDWKIGSSTVDLLAALDSAVSTDNIDTVLDRLRPAHSGYMSLRNALAKLRGMAGADGWPVLKFQETLRPGDRNTAVGDLRRRLVMSGDLDPTAHSGDSHYFDVTLASAVRRFQQRNGLKTDGIVGLDTKEVLNVSIDQRIRQVVLNLERWRWLPHDLGTRYIIVNTADFYLKAVDRGQVGIKMRVVVGRPARRSPVFSANMTFLVTNPYWNVPTTMAVEDILPELQKDVSRVVNQGIRVYKNWEADAPEIDPATVNWHAYHADRFPFKLRQDPGPQNALGRFKFMFPNQFAVYLHDTPNHSIFNRVKRDFSSGCIRVAAPAVLAGFVLAGDEQWTLDALAEVIEKGETRTILLKRPVPVHILYMTAWVEESGIIQYRKDIYSRDNELNQALNQRRPNRQPGFVHQPQDDTIPAPLTGKGPGKQ